MTQQDQQKTLGEIVTLQTEKVIANKDRRMPYIGLEHIASGRFRLIGSAGSDVSISINSVFQKDDILFGKLRPALRKSVRSPFSGYCSTDILVLRCVPGIAPGFASHVFQSDRVFDAAAATAAGTKMPRTSWSDLRYFQVFIPDSIDEQERIAWVLDMIDDGILKTEAVIDKLKQVRIGLLNDLLTRGIDDNGVLRDPLRNPREFRDSLLGKIPRHWDVKVIGSLIAGFESGVSVDSVDTPPAAGEVGVLKTGCVAGGVFDPTQSKRVKRHECYRVRCRPRRDSIIISRMNTPQLVGESAYISDDHDHLFLPDRLWQTIKLPNEPTCIRWLSYLLQSLEVRNVISAGATGTSGSMKNVSQSYVLGIRVRAPSLEEQNRIARLLIEFDEAIASESVTLIKLRHLKVGLMSDLLSGAVRVPTG